jgi:hypothetical protein
VIDDLRGALEAGMLRGGGGRILREGAGEPLEVGAELAERGVVGHHHDPRRDAGNARGTRQLVRDQGARRVLRGHLVAQQALDERVVELLRQDVRRVLVDAAEGVAAAVLADEREALGLLPADALHRRQPAGFPGQVQDLRLDRSGPKVAVGRSQHRPVEATRSIVGARRHALGPRRLLGRDHDRRDAARQRN